MIINFSLETIKFVICLNIIEILVEYNFIKCVIRSVSISHLRVYVFSLLKIISRNNLNLLYEFG